MGDAADFLLALTVAAYRCEGEPARLHVRRTDVPVDYGFLSPAELGYLLEALLSSTDPPEGANSRHPDGGTR